MCGTLAEWNKVWPPRLCEECCIHPTDVYPNVRAVLSVCIDACHLDLEAPATATHTAMCKRSHTDIPVQLCIECQVATREVSMAINNVQPGLPDKERRSECCTCTNPSAAPHLLEFRPKVLRVGTCTAHHILAELSPPWAPLTGGLQKPSKVGGYAELHRRAINATCV